MLETDLKIRKEICRFGYLDKVMAVGAPFTVIRIDKLYKIPKASFDAWITKISDNKRR